MTFTDIVIDLETWSVRPTAAIRSIGAIAFDIMSADVAEQRTFYLNVEDKWGHIDPNTVEWWSRQSEQAQHVLTNDVLPLAFGLTELFLFIEERSNASQVRVWSNGAGFDLPIIKNACANCLDHAKLEVNPTWNFRNERDTRTIYWISEKLTGESAKISAQDIQHYALDDAIYQANKLREAARLLLQIISGKVIW
jgi:hypothetical protein